MSDDLELVERFRQQRTEAAFRALYRACTPAVHATLLRLAGGDHTGAADALQEAWLRAIEGLDGFEGRSTFRTWLTGIAVNCLRETWRRRRRQTTGARDRHGDPRLMPDPATPGGGQRASRLDLETAIAGLPEGYRTILLLHDVEGYTHEEIGELLEIATGTSKSQLWRARRALRRRLEGKADHARRR